METQYKVTEINAENLQNAKTSIEQFVQRRKLVLTGEVPTEILTFPSTNRKKAFRDALRRVIANPTMKSTNMYLRHFGKLNETPIVKVEYSELEKSIKAAREEWKAIRNKAEEARLKYKEVKGDFYKS